MLLDSCCRVLRRRLLRALRPLGRVSPGEWLRLPGSLTSNPTPRECFERPCSSSCGGGAREKHQPRAQRVAVQEAIQTAPPAIRAR